MQWQHKLGGPVKNQKILGKTASPPRRGASTAEAALGRADKAGVGKHDEEVLNPEVHVIAFPRDKRSKVRLRKAEERSQHTKGILPIFLTNV